MQGFRRMKESESGQLGDPDIPAYDDLSRVRGLGHSISMKVWVKIEIN
jgi:hypothetical protein